ncbi:hypothetical protein ACFQX4_23545 [Roseomonas sp. GCM10028921]
MADFDRVRDALLDRAGGGMSLTEAAAKLGITRRALHGRVMEGSVLGVMVGDEAVIPTFQFAEAEPEPSILAGVDGLTKVFREAKAGSWTTLQFLVDHDPNLGGPPIEALRAGRAAAVLHAARAHLHLDEG